jgi:hypothetical protein
MLGTMCAELIVQIPPGEGYADAAGGWLDGGARRDAAGLLEGLSTRPVTREFDRHDPLKPAPGGEPG